MDSVATKEEGTPVAEVTVGSVTISISFAPVTVKVLRPAADGQGEPEKTTKTYDSYELSYYEGSERRQRRAKTLDKAKARAKEIATRLNKDGARAEFMSEKDRRIYVMANLACKPLKLEVDEVCRRYWELQSRLKDGTLEQAVDFMNDHGQQVRHGATSDDILQEYLVHLTKRGVGNYHMRDTKRYVGGFVKAFPGVFSHVQTAAIDKYLATIGGKAGNKNNHRDAIISFYNFAEQKGFLPFGLRLAAKGTTEFFEARQVITSEADVLALMEPTDIYSPEEARRLLAVKGMSRLMPSLEFKMLSGVRTEEIVRLWWPMVVEDKRVIRVLEAVGKINPRQVPILPALDRRLKAIPEAAKHDRICVDWNSANTLYHAWQRLCEKAGVTYRHNAFRNSYFTYRLVILGNDKINQVAEEGGTSVAMLKKNYLSRAPVSMAQAEEWFSL